MRVVLAVVAEVCAVMPFFGGERLEVRSVELDRKNMRLPRIVFVRRQKYRARGFIDSFDAQELRNRPWSVASPASPRRPSDSACRSCRDKCACCRRASLATGTERTSAFAFQCARIEIHAPGVVSVSTIRDLPVFASTKYRSSLSWVRFRTSAHTTPGATHPKRGI